MGKRSGQIYENRQRNLQSLIDRFGLNDVSDKLNRRYDYIKNLSGGKQKARTIGDSLASHIEDSFGLPPGSLDDTSLPKITDYPANNGDGAQPLKKKPKAAKTKLSDSPRTPKDILENRLWHVRQIIKNVDGTNEFSRITGISPGQVTAYAGPNPSRNIGPVIVNRVETVFKLKPGTLDFPPPPSASGKDPLIAEICSSLAHASDLDKALVLNLTQWLVKRSLSGEKTSHSKSSGGLVNATDLLA